MSGRYSIIFQQAFVTASAALLTYYLLKYWLKLNEQDTSLETRTLHGKKLQLNRYELLLLENVIMAKATNPTNTTNNNQNNNKNNNNDNNSNKENGFENIGGLGEVKEALKETLLLPLEQPQLFRGRESLLNLPKGILFYGPPGTGKTLLAKTLSASLSLNFINLRMSTIMDKYFGESEKYVRAAFSLANKLSPCILFLDEIDAFFEKRGGSHTNEVFGMMKAEFLTLWDGLATEGEGKVLVIGCTNRPNVLDEAVMRRLSRSFHIPLPAHPQRKEILSIIMRKEKLGQTEQLDYDEIARLTEGYSGAELKDLCHTAAQRPIHDYILLHSSSSSSSSSQEPSDGIRPLTTEDFVESIRLHPPTRKQSQRYLFESYSHPFGYQEARS